MPLTDGQRRHWRTNLRLTAVLLLAWFLVTFVVGYYADHLNAVFFGWPLYFWIGAQGALIVYLLIIWFYARTMNRLDIRYGVDEDDEDEESEESDEGAEPDARGWPGVRR